MTLLDIGLLVTFALAAVAGFGRGFVVGAFSLVGIVAGLALASVLVRATVGPGNASPYGPLAELAVALAITLAIALGLNALGLGLRSRILVPGGRIADRILGSGLSVIVAVVLVWAGAAVIAEFPQATGIRQALRESLIIQDLDSWLPPTAPLLQAAARFDPLPTFAGPTVDLPAPDANVLLRPGVKTARAGVLRVIGTACGLGVTGSGWVVAPDLVATNAHVVAGEDDTRVQIRGTHSPIRATPVFVDVHDDIALLHVRDLGLTTLAPDTTAKSGLPGAVLGFPEDGPFDARAARIGSVTSVMADDLYGQNRGPRSILTFRGLVRPGNSGGPVVDAQGRVVAMVFASAVGASTRSGYAIPVDLVERAASNAGTSRIGTGSCVDG